MSRRLLTGRGSPLSRASKRRANLVRRTGENTKRPHLEVGLRFSARHAVWTRAQRANARRRPRRAGAMALWRNQRTRTVRVRLVAHARGLRPCRRSTARSLARRCASRTRLSSSRTVTGLRLSRTPAVRWRVCRRIHFCVTSCIHYPVPFLCCRVPEAVDNGRAVPCKPAPTTWAPAALGAGRSTP